MSARYRIAQDLHLRITRDGDLLAWSPRAMAHVKISMVDLRVLRWIGKGADAAKALAAAGLSPRSDLEVEGCLSWFAHAGLLEPRAPASERVVRDAVAALVEGCAVAGTALVDAGRTIGARVARELRRREIARAARHAEPLDLAWDGEPRLRTRTEEPALVTAPVRGEPATATAPVAVSSIAYPLS